MEPVWVTDSMYRVLTNISFYFVENITIFKVTLEVLAGVGRSSGDLWDVY